MVLNLTYFDVATLILSLSAIQLGYMNWKSTAVLGSSTISKLIHHLGSSVCHLCGICPPSWGICHLSFWNLRQIVYIWYRPVDLFVYLLYRTFFMIFICVPIIQNILCDFYAWCTQLLLSHAR